MCMSLLTLWVMQLLTFQPLSSRGYDFHGVFVSSPVTSTIMPPSPTDIGMGIKVYVNMNSTLGAAFIGNIVGAMQVSFLLSKFIY
jgi:hypothetical protein